MPDDIQDPTQDPTQDQGQNPLAALVGLIAQARQQGAPVQQAPLPQVVGPAGTPSNQPWQSILPERPQAQSLSDFVPDATKSTPANNASSASVIHEGEKRQQQLQRHNPLLDDQNRVDPNRTDSGWFRQQFNNPDSEYYGGSPAKRMLQSFMIGLAALGGHEVPSLYQTKREEWQTDLKTAMEQESKDTQQQRVDDVQTRADNRAAQQMKIAMMKEADFQQTFGYKKDQFNFQKQKWTDLQAAREKQAAGKALTQRETELVKGYGPAADQVLTEWRQRNPDQDPQDIIGQPQFLKDVQQKELELKPQLREDALTDKLVQSGADVQGLASADASTRIKAVQASDLSPDDKNFLVGRIINNKSLIGAQAARDRATIYTNNRPVSAIDTRTGQLGITPFQNVKDEPFGTYAAPAQAAKAMGQSAQFDEINRSIDQLDKAWDNAGPIDKTFRAQMIYALDQSEKGKMGQYLASENFKNMTPGQQDLIIATNSANENVMALRSVAGMGQGSQDLRDAIRRIVPSGETPTADYAHKQTATIRQQVNALHNIPQVGTSGLTSPNPPRPQASDSSAPSGQPAQRYGSTLDMNNATGLKDVNTGQFRKFNNPESSVYASGQDLIAKMTRDPNMTLAQMTDEWQGRGLPHGYSADDLAKDLGKGVTPNTKLSDLDPIRVARAIATHETGYQGPAAKPFTPPRVGGGPAKINVISPDGRPGQIPADKWNAAQKLGYRKR